MSFNPRTHMECDKYIKQDAESCWLSIHALTWSATLKGFADPETGETFQSTHSHGVRQGKDGNEDIRACFQSTHSHGVRREHRKSCANIFLFQSTHSHGVRL
ncbi:hypothetical protein DJ90_4789 [Paenibacillus macerans]|uniref:Uncharacterized protein n=1 Tax=Paenibacillus macerans TaxID=44252 RepID=A0A090Y469_PAEMA|nr:hypothetical protein DJ90_4789 [Paenibacillus macerans]